MVSNGIAILSVSFITELFLGGSYLVLNQRDSVEIQFHTLSSSTYSTLYLAIIYSIALFSNLTPIVLRMCYVVTKSSPPFLDW